MIRLAGDYAKLEELKIIFFSLLLMLMPVFLHIKIPSDPEKCKSLFGLGEKMKVAKLLLDFMLDVLLLPYGLVIFGGCDSSLYIVANNQQSISMMTFG